MTTGRLLLLIACALLQIGAFAQAQTPLPTPTVTPDPPLAVPPVSVPLRPLPDAVRVGVDPAAQLPLTLADAVEMALRNNNDIEAFRKDVRIAEFNLRGARGVYDPVATSESFYERLTTPTASLSAGPLTELSLNVASTDRRA